MSLFFIDCEAPMGVGAPSTGDMTCFGAVAFHGLEEWQREAKHDTFYGGDCTPETFKNFDKWLYEVNRGSRPTMVSDNPAYDWQWINFYFHKYFNLNPLGFSARRIGDFYAGLVHDFWKGNVWKKLRITKHDHTPVNDAMGNVEAFVRMLKGERVK